MKHPPCTAWHGDASVIRSWMKRRLSSPGRHGSSCSLLALPDHLTPPFSSAMTGQECIHYDGGGVLSKLYHLLRRKQSLVCLQPFGPTIKGRTGGGGGGAAFIRVHPSNIDGPNWGSWALQSFLKTASLYAEKQSMDTDGASRIWPCA